MIVVFGIAIAVFGGIKNYATTHRNGVASPSTFSAPTNTGKLDQLIHGFKNWKSDLDPTMQIAVSIGLGFLALLAFIASVIVFFIIIMVIQRH